MGKEVAIEIKNLSKRFRLPTEQASGIKQAVVNRLRGIKGYKEQKVLRDISFNIEKGDFFGIVGRNGSGKSTLLKLISGIYVPNSGSIKINGTLVSFIELGVGFNDQLTGRENVYLNGALLGFTVKEIDAMYDEIVEFSELHEFMDQKLKNYSSGMQVRLAFSCAIRAESDILILDEVLAVGDEAFQRKCYQHFAKLRKDKKTVVLVTHSMDSVERFCNKAILIEDGRIIESGRSTKIAQRYRELNSPRRNNGAGVEASEKQLSCSIKTKEIGDNIHIDVVLKPKQDFGESIVTLSLIRDTGERVYRFSTEEKYKKPLLLMDGRPIGMQFVIQNIFPDGIFGATLNIEKYDKTEQICFITTNNIFEINNKNINDVFWKAKTTVVVKEPR